MKYELSLFNATIADTTTGSVLSVPDGVRRVVFTAIGTKSGSTASVTSKIEYSQDRQNWFTLETIASNEAANFAAVAHVTDLVTVMPKFLRAVETLRAASGDWSINVTAFFSG